MRYRRRSWGRSLVFDPALSPEEICRCHQITLTTNLGWRRLASLPAIHWLFHFTCPLHWARQYWFTLHPSIFCVGYLRFNPLHVYLPPSLPKFPHHLAGAQITPPCLSYIAPLLPRIQSPLSKQRYLQYFSRFAPSKDFAGCSNCALPGHINYTGSFSTFIFLFTPWWVCSSRWPHRYFSHSHNILPPSHRQHVYHRDIPPLPSPAMGAPRHGMGVHHRASPGWHPRGLPAGPGQKPQNTPFTSQSASHPPRLPAVPLPWSVQAGVHRPSPPARPRYPAKIFLDQLEPRYTRHRQDRAELSSTRKHPKFHPAARDGQVTGEHPWYRAFACFSKAQEAFDPRLSPQFLTCLPRFPYCM